MKTKYVLTSKTVYGISAKNNEGGVVKPIFLFDKSKKEISTFIKLCNTEELEAVHLKNAISDILYG